MADGRDSPDELPSTAGDLAEQYPDVWDEYADLGKTCSEVGPVDPGALRHVAILSVPTLGFPKAMAAMSWIDDRAE